jgi:hypothetical protein
MTTTITMKHFESNAFLARIQDHSLRQKVLGEVLAKISDRPALFLFAGLPSHAPNNRKS